MVNKCNTEKDYSGLRGDSYRECSEPVQVNGTKQGEQYEYSRGQQGFGNRGQRYHGNVDREEWEYPLVSSVAREAT